MFKNMTISSKYYVPWEYLGEEQNESPAIEESRRPDVDKNGMMTLSLSQRLQRPKLRA